MLGLGCGPARGGGDSGRRRIGTSAGIHRRPTQNRVNPEAGSVFAPPPPPPTRGGGVWVGGGCGGMGGGGGWVGGAKSGMPPGSPGRRHGNPPPPTPHPPVVVAGTTVRYGRTIMKRTQTKVDRWAVDLSRPTGSALLRNDEAQPTWPEGRSAPTKTGYNLPWPGNPASPGRFELRVPPPPTPSRIYYRPPKTAVAPRERSLISPTAPCPVLPPPGFLVKRPHEDPARQLVDG